MRACWLAVCNGAGSVNGVTEAARRLISHPAQGGNGNPATITAHRVARLTGNDILTLRIRRHRCCNKHPETARVWAISMSTLADFITFLRRHFRPSSAACQPSCRNSTLLTALVTTAKPTLHPLPPCTHPRSTLVEPQDADYHLPQPWSTIHRRRPVSNRSTTTVRAYTARERLL